MNLKNLKSSGLRTGALLRFIPDIERVLMVSGDLVDVRSDPQQGTHPQAVSYSICLCEFELSFSFSFEKTSSVCVCHKKVRNCFQ